MFIFACPKMNQKGQPFTWSHFLRLPEGSGQQGAFFLLLLLGKQKKKIKV